MKNIKSKSAILTAVVTALNLKIFANGLYLFLAFTAAVIYGYTLLKLYQTSKRIYPPDTPQATNSSETDVYGWVLPPTQPGDPTFFGVFPVIIVPPMMITEDVPTVVSSVETASISLVPSNGFTLQFGINPRLNGLNVYPVPWAKVGSNLANNIPHALVNTTNLLIELITFNGSVYMYASTNLNTNASGQFSYTGDIKTNIAIGVFNKVVVSRTVD